MDEMCERMNKNEEKISKISERVSQKRSSSCNKRTLEEDFQNWEKKLAKTGENFNKKTTEKCHDYRPYRSSSNFTRDIHECSCPSVQKIHQDLYKNCCGFDRKQENSTCFNYSRHNHHNLFSGTYDYPLFNYKSNYNFSTRSDFNYKKFLEESELQRKGFMDKLSEYKKYQSSFKNYFNTSIKEQEEEKSKPERSYRVSHIVNNKLKNKDNVKVKVTVDIPKEENSNGEVDCKLLIDIEEEIEVKKNEVKEKGEEEKFYLRRVKVYDNGKIEEKPLEQISEKYFMSLKNSKSQFYFQETKNIIQEKTQVKSFIVNTKRAPNPRYIFERQKRMIQAPLIALQPPVIPVKRVENKSMISKEKLHYCICYESDRREKLWKVRNATISQEEFENYKVKEGSIPCRFSKEGNLVTIFFQFSKLKYQEILKGKKLKFLKMILKNGNRNLIEEKEISLEEFLNFEKDFIPKYGEFLIQRERNYLILVEKEGGKTGYFKFQELDEEYYKGSKKLYNFGWTFQHFIGLKYQYGDTVVDEQVIRNREEEKVQEDDTKGQESEE